MVMKVGVFWVVPFHYTLRLFRLLVVSELSLGPKRMPLMSFALTLRGFFSLGGAFFLVAIMTPFSSSFCEVFDLLL